MKKILLLMLLLLTAMIINFAVSAETWEDFEYRILKDGTAEITRYGGKDQEIVIPSNIDGIPVTSIGNYAFNFSYSLTSVTLPDSITSIGENAFYDCSNLISVFIPDSVTSIGDSAFYGCSSLTSISIPNSVTSIGDYAFEKCSSLTSVTLPEGLTAIGIGTFCFCISLTSISLPDSVTSIGNRAFYECNSLTSVSIPNRVTQFSSKTFHGCNQMILIVEHDSFAEKYAASYGLNFVYSDTPFVAEKRQGFEYTILENGAAELSKYTGSENEIIIPYMVDGHIVVSIGDHAFSQCSSLTSVSLPDGITSIGKSAFSNCSSLTSITIPDSVTSIGDYAFSECNSLTSVTLPEGITSIGKGIFYICKNLSSISIPDSVTSIGDRAFSYCYGLTSVTIPKGVISIGQSAFSSCSSLSSISLPDSVISIGDNAFEYCSSLTSVTLREGLTSIGIGAFGKCSSLTSMIIPDSVTYIGDGAFIDCSSLSSITLPDSVTSIGDYAFYGCRSLTSITIPDGVVSIGKSAFEGCKSLTSITIPEGVTSIGDRTFSYCSSLASITIPEGVTSIGDGAFKECSSLTSITIPEGVTSIGDYAFDYCSSLTSITIPEGVTSIGEYIFVNCSSLISVDIPDSMTSIPSGAFGGCSCLTSIIIPDNINFISGNAFYGCNDLVLTVGRNTYAEEYAILSERKFEYTDGGDIDPFHDPRFDINSDKVLLKYRGQASSVTIPDGVVAIGNAAFSDYKNLTEVLIPESVTSIGESAFRRTGLTSVTIPASVLSIGRSAFMFCFDLKTVTIQNKHTVIEGNAFESHTVVKYEEQSKEEPSETDRLLPVDIVIGDVITFGHYEQDNNNDNGPEPIEWLVLSVENDRVLVISKYGLDTKEYQSSSILGEYKTWEDSELRKWLDTVFYNNAFNSSEKANIVVVNNNNPDNMDSGLKGGNNTKDEVFLLSIEEVGKYLTNKKDRQCQATSFTQQNTMMKSIPLSFGKQPAVEYDDSGNGSWWLRSPGGAIAFLSGPRMTTSIVNMGGNVDTTGLAYGEYAMIRPALWLYKKSSDPLNSDLGTTEESSAEQIISEPYSAIESLDDMILDTEYRIEGLGTLVISEYWTYDSYFNGEGYQCKDYYDGKSDADEIGLFIDITNTTDTIKNYLNHVSVEFIYDNMYVFKGYWQQVSANHDTCIEESNVKDVALSYQGHYWFGGKIPDAVINGSGPLRLEITIDDVRLTYHIRNIVKSDSSPELIPTETPIPEVVFKYILLGNGTAEITGAVGSAQTINIPSVIDGMRVTSIGNYAFQSRNDLNSVSISDGVISIGNSAFYNCGNLISVSLPESVSTIGEKAFSNCSSLTEMELPKSVTYIGESAFRDCSNLVSISLPASLTSIEKTTFFNCSSLAQVSLPQGIVSVGNGAFRECSSLSSVTLPTSVTSIGDRAFAGCYLLESVEIPNSVTSIGADAFEKKTKLISVDAGEAPEPTPSDTTRIQSSSGETTDPVYTDFLSVLKTYADDENAEIHKYEDILNQMKETNMISGWKLKDSGYAFYDIDGDGTTELLLGDIKYGGLKYLYAVSDGQLTEVLHSGYKNIYTLNTDGTFTQELFTGASSSVLEYYLYSSGEIHLTQILIRDSSHFNTNSWYTAESYDNIYASARQLSDAEADSIIASHTSAQIEYIPLLNNDSGSGTQTVNVQVHPTVEPKSYPGKGDIVTFGHYEQDNNKNNGAEMINWKVLSIENGKALLMSTKVLDAMPFNTGGTNSWDVSSLREWMNKTFMNSAFNSSERDAIVKTSHMAGNLDTFPDIDSVFILSRAEIQTYLPAPADRQIEATPYAISHNVYLGENGLACWWTRTYLSKGVAYNIWSNGDMDHGDNVTVADGGVLPAVTIDIEKWMKLP